MTGRKKSRRRLLGSSKRTRHLRMLGSRENNRSRLCISYSVSMWQRPILRIPMSIRYNSWLKITIGEINSKINFKQYIKNGFTKKLMKNSKKALNLDSSKTVQQMCRQKKFRRQKNRLRKQLNLISRGRRRSDRLRATSQGLYITSSIQGCLQRLLLLLGNMLD